MDPFDAITEKDGYHVTRIDSPTSVSLFCACYGGGEPIVVGKSGTTEIWHYDNPTHKQRGEMIRAELLGDALARFLNTGGSWEDAALLMANMRDVAPGGLAFPGYHLLDSYRTTEGTFQHVFVKDGTEEAVLWEEPNHNEHGGLYGGFIERKTLEQIRKDQEEDGWRQVGAEPAEEAGGAGPLQLPDRRGAESAFVDPRYS